MPTLFLLSNNNSPTHKYVLKDMLKLVPNSVKESKSNSRSEIIELMSMHECETLVYFECFKKKSVMWLMDSKKYSVEAHIDIMFSIDRLKFLVNTYLNTGHLVLFSKNFDEKEELKILKNILIKIFKRDDEFTERAILFSYEDGKVFFRNYKLDDEFHEIGPRIVFTIKRIIAGEFTGEIVYENSSMKSNEECTNLLPVKRKRYNAEHFISNDLDADSTTDEKLTKNKRKRFVSQDSKNKISKYDNKAAVRSIEKKNMTIHRSDKVSIKDKKKVKDKNSDAFNDPKHSVNSKENSGNTQKKADRTLKQQNKSNEDENNHIDTKTNNLKGKK